MSATQAFKKRKRDQSHEAHFELSSATSGKVGPLLVSFPAVKPSSPTPFKCYSRKKPKVADQCPQEEHREESYLVVGETESVEFVSNEDETLKVAVSGCKYIIALYNTQTKSISVLPDYKSPHILTHAVKALKSLPPSAAPSKLQYLEAKTALGETFGTKKQKANIRAQERNRIDVGAMEGVMTYVMDSIDKGAEGLLDEEETKEAADKNRLIPPFSPTATDPDDIYPLHDVIPELEWKAISTSSLDSAQTEKAKIATLPYQKSQWINDHLKALSESTGKTKKKKLKILHYISAMLAFRQSTLQPVINKEKLYERLGAVPGSVVDGLISRFSETARGSSSFQSTTATKTSLLTHVFTLCLKVDNFACNTAIIAHDLSLPVLEVNNLFKSLGCKISKLGEKDKARLGISGDEKRAVLKAPVEFPKPKLRKHFK